MSKSARGSGGCYERLFTIHVSDGVWYLLILELSRRLGEVT
jgi:hypothetical protein